MIRRLQYQFILTAGFALLLVLISVVGVINLAMRAILDNQTNQVLNQLATWDGTESGILTPRAHPMIGTMLSNYFFRVLLDENDCIIAIDRSNMVSLEQSEAETLTAAVLAQGNSVGRLETENTLYTYRVTAVGEDGFRKLVFLDCTPAQNMISELLRVSFYISIVAMAGFVLIFSLMSKRVVRPVVANMENQKRFITNASHELKTPLAIISANTELLEAMNGENEWTQNIVSQVRRMTGLVNALVMLSKLGEQQKLELGQVDLSAISAEAAEAIRPVALREGKTLTSEISPEISVEGDARLLQMLLNILLDNAAKYCDGGGEIRLTLPPRAAARPVLLTVSNDYAAGADVDFSRFFERFYQEDQSHNSRQSGFGIGLSTAKEIMEQLKGGIRAVYQDGRIAFQVTLRPGKAPRRK